jgi:two-component system cell cycle sensor histidine kinase/response regulator CckA
MLQRAVLLSVAANKPLARLWWNLASRLFLPIVLLRWRPFHPGESYSAVAVHGMANDLVQQEADVGVHAALASIVESSHDAIVGMTSDGVITSWNPAAARLYGYAAKDIIGQPAQMIVPPERRADLAAVLARIMAGEEVERDLTQRVCQDGTAVTVSQTISPIIDDTGAVIGAATASRRFSELQEARDRFEVRMAQLRLEAVDAAHRFEVLADEVRERAKHAHERFDVEVSHERSQLRDASDEFQARMSTSGTYTSSPAVNRELQQAQDRFEVRVAGQRAEAEDAADRFETQVDYAHDQSQHAQQRFEGLVDKERSEAQEASNRFQDRTDAERDKARVDKQRLESQLQQSQRLEVLGQLAGGVAHDFNNLLAVILNYAAFVAEELAATPQSESIVAARRDVGQIQRAAERATALTHQLLAFARCEVIKPRVLDLNDIVTDVKQLLDRTIGEDVVLHTDLTTDVWPIFADTGQIEQILVNLAVNARDAMSGGGTLSIGTANVSIDDRGIAGGSPLPAGRYLRLRVGDTGIGMTPEVIAHVFEPFYTTKRDGSGTGLGLATVYGIVAQANGTIDIDSQPGDGTTFTMMFPVTDEVALPIEQAPTYRHVPTGQTVLLVEDEQALREVTERIFTRGGYHVLSAADGDEAITIAAGYNDEIHLLVTDVVMPHMLGKEVAERIRHLRPDIKVLYVSGYAQPVLTSSGRLDDDVHLIEKPFSASAIIQKTGQLLHLDPGK